MEMIGLGLLLIFGSLFTAVAAFQNWDWFMDHHKARLWVNMFGRRGARIFYYVFAGGLSIAGICLFSSGVATEIHQARRNIAPGQPGGGPADAEGAIRQAFATYKDACLTGKGQAAANSVNKATFQHYLNAKAAALSAGKNAIDQMSVAKQISALRMRMMIPAAELRQMSGRDLFVYAVEQGWVGKENVAKQGIGIVNVNGFRAEAVVTQNGVSTPQSAKFVLENGQWKFNLAALMGLADEVFDALQQRSGKSKQDFVRDILGALANKTITPEEYYILVSNGQTPPPSIVAKSRSAIPRLSSDAKEKADKDAKAKTDKKVAAAPKQKVPKERPGDALAELAAKARQELGDDAKILDDAFPKDAGFPRTDRPSRGKGRPDRRDRQSIRAKPTAGNSTQSAINPTVNFPVLTEPAKIPFASYSYKQEGVRGSKLFGSRGGKELTDKAPQGGILVGAILVKGRNWGGALHAIQPVYQIGRRYVPGKRMGTEGGTEELVLAKPGYVVAGFRMRSGLALNALQLVFMKLNGTTLNRKDSYGGPWVGSAGGGPSEFYAQGHASSGLFVQHNKDLHGLGLRVIDRLQIVAAAPPEMRQWSSSDGAFGVQAIFVSSSDDKVTLKRGDDTTIEVPLSQLSDDDRTYVKSRKQ